MTVMGTIDRDDLCTLGAKISRARDAAYAMARGLKEDYDDGAAGSMWHFYYLLQDFEAEIKRIEGAAQSSTAATYDPTIAAIAETRAAQERKTAAGPDKNEELVVAYFEAEKKAYRAPVTSNAGAIAKLEYLVDDESLELPEAVEWGIAEVVAFLRRGGHRDADAVAEPAGGSKQGNRVAMTLDEYDRATLRLENAAYLFKAALELSGDNPDDLPIQLVGQAYDNVSEAREILTASQKDNGSPGNE